MESPRRYPHSPVPKTYPGSQGWRCECPLPKYKRHVDPPQCVSQEDVDLWRAHYPEATVGDKGARVLVWLAKEFEHAIA